jgi:hypothetical protein
MTNQLNGANEAVPVSEEVVVKSLSELPKTERRQITSELMRIHNLVNSAEHDLRKMGEKDKASKFRIEDAG